MTIGDLVTLKKSTQLRLWGDDMAPEEMAGMGVVIDNYESTKVMTMYYKVQFTGIESGWFEDFELNLVSKGTR